MKQWIKKILADGWRRKYDRLLEKKTVSYDTWIKKTEMERGEGGDSGLTVKQVPYEACSSFCLGRVLQKETADIILFADSEGRVSDQAERQVAEYFSAHSGIKMLYGDEDVLSPEGIRYTPWFKPDWSPDTFLSFFYFGSIFAVRTEILRELTVEEKKWILENTQGGGINDNINDTIVDIYCICYVLARKCGGFEKRRTDAGTAEEWNFPIGHLDEVLFHGKTNREMKMERRETPDFSGAADRAESFPAKDAPETSARKTAGTSARKMAEGEKLSVIIPSKDNPEVLKRCILSLAAEAEQGLGKKYEIVLVDNGSAEDTRKALEKWLEESGIPCKYLYRKEPFHFSRMCNMGAEAAEGDVLLFLNDDVEIPEGKDRKMGSFFRELCDMARRPYTGAVGVKLYYPDSVRIQHAGIVNLRLGPVHKLQFKEDHIGYYYGWNRGKRNVIAVTGACLAVEKKKFLEAGGFPEELPVAFNDVDLCFSLFEKGYYNVVIQDFALYHHESLSRGNDDDREKLLRLLREKDKLYERHPGLYGKDPFYHKYLVGDMLSTGFDLKAEYEPEKEKLPVRTMDREELERDAREDACVIISLEYAGPAEEGHELLIQGYCFVSGSDNALFEKRILLKAEEKEGKLLAVLPEPLRRKDVEDNLPDQIHVGLTGFCAAIDGEKLAKGSYRIGILAKDKCSRQKLYAWTNRYLEV